MLFLPLCVLAVVHVTLSMVVFFSALMFSSPPLRPPIPPTTAIYIPFRDTGNPVFSHPIETIVGIFSMSVGDYEDLYAYFSDLGSPFQGICKVGICVQSCSGSKSKRYVGRILVLIYDSFVQKRVD